MKRIPIWCVLLLAASSHSTDISFKQTSSYYGGFRGSLTILNDGTSDIDGWQLSCITDFTVSDASGAKFTQTDRLVFDNESWTNLLPAGMSQTITFGGTPEITANSFSDCLFNDLPQAISGLSEDIEQDQHDATKLSASFKMTSSYEGAFRGKVVIKNLDVIKTSRWSLSCDTDFTITDASGAEYSQIGDRFEFTHTPWGAEIQPNASATINFGAQPAFTTNAFQNCQLNDQATQVAVIPGSAEGIDTQAIVLPELDASEQITAMV